MKIRLRQPKGQLSLSPKQCQRLVDTVDTHRQQVWVTNSHHAIARQANRFVVYDV
jgi:hypothetical protein